MSTINIILLGDPAAGKATQAILLRKKYKLKDLDMGKCLRKISATTQDAKLKKSFAETLNKGKLTPTRIVRQILHDEIFNTPASKGILFNGTPKMIGEAKLVRRWLKQTGRTNVVVLYLKIPHSEVLQRMHGRKEYFKGKYSKRADDTVTALRNRVKYYRSNIQEVLQFFKDNYTLKVINGMGSVEDVYQRLEKGIHEHADKNTGRH